MRRAIEQLAAEFVGTFFVVFFASGALIAGPWQKSAGETGFATLCAAFAYGLAVAVMTEITGPISGGHLNPAISLGAWAARKIGGWRLFGYSLVQILAGFAAARTLAAIFPQSAWRAAGLGTPVLSASLSRAQGMTMEAVLAFGIALIFFRTALRDGKPSGWAVGAAIAAAVLVAMPATGAGLNPARILGPAVLSDHWANQGVWWVGPLLGGVLGAWCAGALGSTQGVT